MDLEVILFFVFGIVAEANSSTKLIDVVSINIRKLQTGVAQFYALVMMLGIVASLFWIILIL